ncbi:MAG TPA: hypothetical protein VFE51_05540 [Verrucomicrobiae bacterium]|nr:hypothetical protein [Verrucomicrobiae bacterium]
MKNSLSSRVGAITSAVGLGVGLAGARADAQTNLVANGSFEAGPIGVKQFAEWAAIGPADNFSDYGVANSSVYPYLAQQGKAYAFFRGHPTDNSQDCLGTTVNLKVGGLYNITYYLGTDGSTLGTGAAMWVVIGSSFGIDLTQDLLLTAFYPNSASAIPYQKFSTNYLATSSSPILSFHGINATNGIAATNAILLDNVSMALTYPPLGLNLSDPNLLKFSWPLTHSPYRLQVNASLTTTNWVTLTNQPSNVGTSSQIILPAQAGARFFRLTLP